jgi:hypothetical protein
LDQAVIATSTVKSPDGLWIARSTTTQFGGPGTAGLQIAVDLVRIARPKEPIQILLIDPVTSWEDPATRVSMSWLDADHLVLRYPDRALIDFQAIKAAGIEIAAESANPQAPSAPTSAPASRSPGA